MKNHKNKFVWRQGRRLISSKKNFEWICAWMGRNSSLHVVNISKIFATIFPSTVFMYLLFKISLLSSEWCLRIYINLNLTVQKLQSRAGLWFAWLRKLFYQTGLWPQRICIQERFVSCYIMRLNNYNPCNYHSHLYIIINFVFKGGIVNSHGNITNK